MKITHKLIIFITFNLISLLSIIILSIENSNNFTKKDNYKQIESLVFKANNFYTMFLKDKNIALIKKYNENLINARIINSKMISEGRDLLTIKIESLRDYTNKTFEYWKLRGLNENNGYEGNFRENVHNLEDLLENEQLDLLTITMLQIRRSEKDFILRHKPEYVEKVLTKINLLEKQTSHISRQIINQDSILILSKKYKYSFLKLVNLLDKLQIRNIKMTNLEYDLNNIIEKKINYLNSKNIEFTRFMYISYFIFLISIVFISFVMYKRILNPISMLIEKTKNISNGNYKDLVLYKNKDEIGEFANSFNTMVQKFLDSQKALENLNIKLDLKVNERTDLLQKEILIRKETELKLEKYNQEVNLLLDKEKQLSKLKTKFVATVSHEYRTPLTVILNSTYLVKQYAIVSNYESMNNYIQRIQFSVAQMKGILEDTLNFGEIENGNYKVNKTQFDLDLLIENIIQDFKTINSSREIEYNNPDNIKTIISDKKAIHHCLNNLITNAIKFSQERIIINLNRMEFENTISVTDFGIGISKDEQENIFSAFYRTNNVKNINGTGLGLSITKKYIESVGGYISLYSNLNQGSTFKLHLSNEN